MLHREKVLAEIMELLRKATDRDLGVVLAFVQSMIRKEK